MTPIKDYSTRHRLITSGEENRKMAHYQRLIALGWSEVDAANESGWHPILDVSACCVIVLVVACFVAAALLYIDWLPIFGVALLS